MIILSINNNYFLKQTQLECAVRSWRISVDAYITAVMVIFIVTVLGVDSPRVIRMSQVAVGRKKLVQSSSYQ